MPNYFLGISSSKKLFEADATVAYWCVKSTAQKGDIILLYCPRAASFARQGVFAEAVILEPPNEKCKDNNLCRAYGLYYVTVEIKRRFNPSLTAKDIKSDRVLGVASFVRRNFQGTTFSIEESQYKRIIELVEEKKKRPKPNNFDRLRSDNI